MAAILQLWQTLKEAIAAYTGLSPTAFFGALGVAVAIYHVFSGFFRAPLPPIRRTSDMPKFELLLSPGELGEISEEDLKAYDGSDPKKPLLMAIKGQIYDVSQSRMFYGPGGPYALFAGKDASRALAKMSFEDKDLTGDTSGLGPFELEALQDWEFKFMSKYVKVGSLKKILSLEGVPTGSSEVDSLKKKFLSLEGIPTGSSQVDSPAAPEVELRGYSTHYSPKKKKRLKGGT